MNASISQLDRKPSVEEMWEMLQQQQDEIERLKLRGNVRSRKAWDDIKDYLELRVKELGPIQNTGIRTSIYNGVSAMLKVIFNNRNVHFFMDREVDEAKRVIDEFVEFFSKQKERCFPKDQESHV